jgi:hypothetical protein
MKWRKSLVNELKNVQTIFKCPSPSLITYVHQASLSTLLAPFHHTSNFCKLHDVQTHVGGFLCFNENCEFLSFLTLERTNPIYFLKILNLWKLIKVWFFIYFLNNQASFQIGRFSQMW